MNMTRMLNHTVRQVQYLQLVLEDSLSRLGSLAVATTSLRTSHPSSRGFASLHPVVLCFRPKRQLV